MRPLALLAALSILSCHKDPPARPTPAPAPSVTVARADATAGAPASAVEPSAPPGLFHGTGQFLPQGAAVQGWRQSGGVRFAAGQELFQLIDGAGEKYIRYGFHDLARTEYRGANPAQVVTVEIYDMASPLGAFGQYSMLLSDERDPATMQPRATQHGNGGFLGGSQLVFWKSKYLVQVNFMDEDSGDETALAADAQRTLPAFAAAVANAIPNDPQGPPAPPAALPSEGVVWGGVTRLADNVFGLTGTGAAWVGHYRAPSGARYRLALFDTAAEADARRLVATLRTPQAVGIPSLGDDAFSVSREQGEVTFVRRGATLLALADAQPAAPQSLTHAERLTVLRAALSPAVAPAAH